MEQSSTKPITRGDKFTVSTRTGVNKRANFRSVYTMASQIKAQRFGIINQKDIFQQPKQKY